ncbi:MAG: hypothetical protein HKO77_01140 [Gemmatimonadetes bacterium]|nr:hypothetical protein [Gemmatimonadota bacterium]
MRVLRHVPVLVAASLLLSCGSPDDPTVAGRAGEWTLTTDRLAELMVLAQPFPLEEEAAFDLAFQWVSVSALAQDAAARDLLEDAAARNESMWLERREWILEQDREARLGADVALTPSEVRAAFDSDSLRLVAHVLRRVGPETPAQERLLQQRTTERILAALIDGGGWDVAVAQSEDPATREVAGLLGLFGPGELQPAALGRAAFRLGPGEASAVVQSPDGFHIVYRPQFDDARGLFTQRLHQRRLLRAAAAADRILASERAVEVADGGVDLARSIVEDPPQWMGSEDVVVVWSGGDLRASVVARYAAALPDGSREALTRAGDEEQVRFLTDLATREIRIAEFAVPAEAATALDSLVHQGHRAELEYWLTGLSVDGVDPPSRQGVATYMEALVARRQEASVVSPVLEAWLLSRFDHAVHPAGIQSAVAAARTMIQGAGSGP